MHTFPLNDRAANYGDGIFTTMAVTDGRVALFHRHLDRLLRDASRLGLILCADSLADTIKAQALQVTSGTLKLLVSAGQGGRGYARDESAHYTLYFSHHPAPDFYPSWRQHGIAVSVSEVKLATQPLLAGLKHCNRLEQVFIKRAIPAGVDDVLVCDQSGNLIEASAANIFWKNRDVWHTPALTQSGVAGVMREFVIEQMTKLNMSLQCADYPVSDIKKASAVFLTNALMQIVPVHTALLSQTFTYDVKPVTALQRKIEPAYQDEYNAS